MDTSPRPTPPALPPPAPPVAVVTPVRNKRALTLRFLESLRRLDYPRSTVILVDDGSTDGTGEAVARQFPPVVVLRADGSLWWSGGTNAGVRYALETGHDYVLTINNDVTVRPDFLSRLVATAQAHPRSIVGARNNFLDQPTKVLSIGAGMHWQLGCPMNMNGRGLPEADLARLPRVCPVPTLTGCGTLVPAGCYREIGLYDERWCPQYHGDSDFVLRAARHGYRAYVDLDAVIFNDADNTSDDRSPFSRRSPLYWRPQLALRWRYSPRRHLPLSLARYVRLVTKPMLTLLWRPPAGRAPAEAGPPRAAQ
jgi:GT2 family glycosyltransferase